MATRIVLAEDHTILREGLRKIIESEPDFQVVGEAGDGLAAVRLVQELHPDLLLLDLSMPRMNGVDVLRNIGKEHVNTIILVLSVHHALEHVLPVLQEGARGYVLKDARGAELLMAIKTVVDGKRYLSPLIQEKIECHSLNSSTKKDKTCLLPLEKLTNRELEILKLVAEGHSNKGIGELLFISPKTVDKHRTNLMAKLQIHSSRELALFAMSNGILEQDGE